MTPLFLYLAFALACCPLAFFWCCCGCKIFSDSFNADRLATKWDSRSGSWSVGSGVLTTTDADALLVTVAEVDALTDGVYLSVKITCDSENDSGAGVIAYVDDDNYWFAEIQPGATDGTLKLFERSGGANTQRGDTATVTGFTAGDYRTLLLCYSNDRILAVAANGEIVFYEATLTVAGTQAGVKTGSAVDTLVTFDVFDFQKHNDADGSGSGGNNGCPTCATCTVICQDHLAPDEIAVTFRGFGVSAGCNSLNEVTFILSYIGACTWQGTFPNEWVTDSVITAHLFTVPLPNRVRMTVSYQRFGSAFGSDDVWESGDIGLMPIDCMNQAFDLNLTFDEPTDDCSNDGTPISAVM
jgi:hypothetical protein